MPSTTSESDIGISVKISSIVKSLFNLVVKFYSGPIQEV